MTKILSNIRDFAINAAVNTAKNLDPKRLVADLTAKKVATVAFQAMTLGAVANWEAVEGGLITAWVTLGACVAGSIWGPAWFFAECPGLVAIAAALPTP